MSYHALASGFPAATWIPPAAGRDGPASVRNLHAAAPGLWADRRRLHGTVPKLAAASLNPPAATLHLQAAGRKLPAGNRRFQG